MASPPSQEVKEGIKSGRRPVDLLSSDLSAVARAHIKIVRRSMANGPFDRLLRLGQRTIGSTWIEECTKYIRHVHGTERLPWFDPNKSYVVVCNHRSFFDLYVVTAYLVKRGLRHRLMFPVKSSFFYEQPLGIFVNAVMSFFAMYPPIFRDRTAAHLNVASLDEMMAVLERGGVFLGLHPEGTRNKSDDPYSYLPAQTGVGRIVHATGVDVIPAFINGLGNDLPRQVLGNFTGDGAPIHVVFGAPVPLGDLLARNGSPRVYKEITERCMDEVKKLGEEERAHRAARDHGARR
jgi:1-acyl-sn-glycerol-3-phosphate acyltransferase